MTTRAQHTPLPWARGEVRCNQVLGGGRSGRAEVVCSGSDDANLDFIVRACNSFDKFDDLVAALKELARTAIAAQPYVHTGCHTDERHNRVNNELITACTVASAALAKASA